ncbi:hypothetical protein ACHAXS_004000 [Conticribra weissflogii]
MRKTDYIQYCVIEHIPPSVVWGGIFHGIDCVQGARFALRTWGIYSGGILAYHSLICPMEAFHGRQSALHNVASGAIFGYVGVSRGLLGVPFINPQFLYGGRFPPSIIGGAVYGTMGGALAMLGGKRI